MFHALIDSLWAFRALLAVPAIVMIGRYLSLDHSLGHLMDSSGEWAARMLILTLAITPIRIMLKQWGARAVLADVAVQAAARPGFAAFLYAAMHLGIYIVRQANLNVILYDIPYKEYLAGWIAFAAFVVLALTSNDWSVHHMGRWWKWVQRLTYVSAVALFLHWLWIRLDHTAVILHFLPLVLLEAYRIWYNFARPSGVRH